MRASTSTCSNYPSACFSKHFKHHASALVDHYQYLIPLPLPLPSTHLTITYTQTPPPLPDAATDIAVTPCGYSASFSRTSPPPLRPSSPQTRRAASFEASLVPSVAPFHVYHVSPFRHPPPLSPTPPLRPFAVPSRPSHQPHCTPFPAHQIPRTLLATW